MPNTPKAKIAVIGGTGLEDIEGLTDIKHINIDTPLGNRRTPSPSANGRIGMPFYPDTGGGISFLPPNTGPRQYLCIKIDRVEQIIAVCSCGSFKQELARKFSDPRPDHRRTRTE